MKIDGYDYRTERRRELERREWRDEMRPILASGGWRRVEDGETFIHDASGRIALEIYERVTP